MIKTLALFFKYITNPTPTINQNKRVGMSYLKDILTLLLVVLIFNGLILTIRFVLINKGIMPPLHFVEGGYYTSIFYSSLFVLLFSPVAEELGFRAVLKPTPLNLALSFSTIVYFLLSITIPFKLYADFKYLVFPVLIFIVTFIIALKLIGADKINYANKYHGIILYASTLLFTLFHLKDFFLTTHHIIWLPLICLPYIALGFIFSYVRSKYGLAYSILFHSFYNSVPLLLSLLLLS